MRVVAVRVVVRVGLGPTPMLYYAEASSEEVQGGIQITGSHNPANYNGFKMVFMGRPFFGDDILEIGRRAEAGDWADGSGTVETREILGEYIERLICGLREMSPAAVAESAIVAPSQGCGTVL